MTVQDHSNVMGHEIVNRTMCCWYLLIPQRNIDEVVKRHLQKGKGREANVAEWSVSLVMSSLS